MTTKHWPKFRSHKVVQAAKIMAIHEDVAGDPYVLLVDPGTGILERIVPTETAMLKRARPDDYAVVYADGYSSVSPKAAFEEGYEVIGVDADG